MKFLEACTKWSHFLSKPAVYLLVVNEPFEHGSKMTDILYIGETMHFGSIPSNCRLWDYYTKATQHERNIVEKVEELENTGKSVEIWWCHDFPNNLTHRSYEKLLLHQYSREHGAPPKLNKK